MSEEAKVLSSIDLDTLESIRADFPILHQEVNGRPLVYLDNAASSQRPEVVISAMVDYYRKDHSNVHRGAHSLANRATVLFENARLTAQQFLNAASEREVNFTKGTTEGINLLAHSFGRKFIHTGDNMIISELEHHSNIVPWQLICIERKAELRIVRVTENGEWDLDHFDELLDENTKLISTAWVSNSMGTINPVREIISKAHSKNALVHLDAAQAAPHFVIDVQELDVDFMSLSGHKVFAPTGTGIFYGKANWLEDMLPYQAGGEMIRDVDFAGTTFNDLPFKFEAGTPNIAGAIGLAEGFKYLMQQDRESLIAHERRLLDLATELALEIDGLKILGPLNNRAGVLSFNIDRIHAADLGHLLDGQGVAVRTGHHCCQPLMKKFGIDGTCRASFSIYNTEEEVHIFIKALKRAIKMLS